MHDIEPALTPPTAGIRTRTRIRLGVLILLGLIVGLLAPHTRAPADEKPVDGKLADLRVGQLRVAKVLFLGNSITLHGPAENIGWKGNWGMAASAQEKDYVHLLLARLADAAHGQPAVRIRNIADFERLHSTYDIPARLKEDLDFQPDLVIVAIGENVSALKTPESQEQYHTAFTQLLAELQKHGHPTLIVRSCFWSNQTKDEIMRRATAAAGATWVDISALGKAEQNYARAEREIKHAGVGAHPGDRGMEAIAEAVWMAIKERAAGKTE